ncbi:MAG: DEAD/DEAH box helicase [Bacillota bacterium]
MPQINITDKQIKSLARSTDIYQRGVSYYLANKVSDFIFSPDEGTVYASVSGGLRYSVQLSVDREGSVNSCLCSCPAYGGYSGVCKHIVAVLLKARQYLLTTSQKHEIQNSAAQDILGFFESYDQDLPHEEINLDLELYLLRSPHRLASSHLQFKIGQQRMYIVKDIWQLLQSIKTGRPLTFGKQFTFEPGRHAFKKEDLPVIDLLLEMMEQYTALLEMQGAYYDSMNSSSLFKQKSLPLTGFYLKKFLDSVGDKQFQFWSGQQPVRSMKVIRQELPLEFSLHAQDQDLALVLEATELPLLLSQDGSYFCYRQEIYMASPDQKIILPPMLNALHKGSTKNIVFPSGKKERFVSEVLPFIEKTCKVFIEPGLANKFTRENLISKIYFDRSGNGITARLEFHYGDVVINPFASGNNSRTTEDFIIVREAEKERKLLNILEQSEFAVTQGEIHLDDDQQIFQFIVNYLPLLQDLAEIYYSSEFKLNLRTSTTFSGRVRLDENLDLLEISFQYSDIDQDELSDIFISLQRKRKYHRLRDGSFLDLNQPELDYVAQLMENLALRPDDLGKEVLKLPKYRAMYIDNFLRQVNLPGLQRSKAFKQLVQSILEPQDGEYAVPTVLQNILRDYQKTGFKWLKTLAVNGLGGILADDMGLGKTLQVISFVLSERAGASGPALVIAPTSLVYNWMDEVQKFAPELQVLVVIGSPEERHTLLEDISRWDLVVTSYPLIRRDIDIYNQLDFSYCFLDEAQHIKNPQTINAKSVQQIKARGYFALTGTPIENSLSELWSIFNFIMPGYLLSLEDFRRKYEIPIAKGDDPEPLKELSRHTSPFILRRLKKNVLKELPDKIETLLKAQMTDEQKKIYLAYLQEARGTITREIATVGFDKSRLKILAALTRLRQICCHPSMFLENYTGESGKMLLFQEILADALDGGHRILVFSQFTTLLDIIQEQLILDDINHFYLKGSTKAADRTHMAQLFNNGVGKVFLISLKAGGTGLNLTGADMVIHFDPWWNPAVEEQATDRTHRIGQKNVVQVIKLITQGTIEDKVYQLQQKKKALIEAVIQPGETMISKLTEEELRKLFELT